MKKASAANKVASLYLVDAISRAVRSKGKKEGKQKAADEASPKEGTTAVGSCATFLAKVEQILIKLVIDAWENGLPEHRVTLPLLPLCPTNRK